VLALSITTTALGDEFARMHITPFTQTKALNAFVSGKQSYFILQPEYAWGTGFTGEGVTFGFLKRPSGDDNKGATFVSGKLLQFHPDSSSTVTAHLIHATHQFNSDSDDYRISGSLFYGREQGWGFAYGGNFTVGTNLFEGDKDPGFYVSGSVNYAEDHANASFVGRGFTRSGADISRGTALSINCARSLADNLRLEFDHTFSSKFTGGTDWFLRTSYDYKPGTQLRFSVAKNELYLFELGFFFNTK
jgi:hypothetical protein